MNIRSNWAHRLAVAVLIAATSATAFSGVRTYRSFQLLQSAYAVGAPKTSAIRGWMTLKYVAGAYRVSETSLTEGLGLPPGGDPDKSLKAIADALRIPPPQYVQRVQRVVAKRAPEKASDDGNAASGLFGAIGDQVLTGLLVYGYSALGLTVLFASIGLPLPDGFAMALAGSLAAQGRIDWMWAGAVAVVASVLGDLAGYGIGRMLSGQFLEKRGQWIGYTPARRERVHALFDQWGLLTVFITRTFVSYLSSVANIFAGVSRFRASKFLAVAIFGRVLWTAGYLGLGYVVGADLEAAAGFLTNLSFFIVSITVLAGAAWAAFSLSPALG
jgi:membrane protein DedA with SNARE-associated domain